MAVEGLIVRASRQGAAATIDRVVAGLKARGVTVFARIDHAAGAKSVDMALRPTELIIFGNPKAGTPLMQAAQSLGIDLPLKALAWEDEAGTVWLGYNDIRWLARRHGLGEHAAPAVAALAGFLEALAAEAAG
jgi:uncharacterized protein (DUF302 family)